MTSKTFGSDGMPLVCLAGVTLHEVCLTFMMTSISHPLIFAMLILCDVSENTYCLWSLHQTMNTAKSTKIVPVESTDKESVPSRRRSSRKTRKRRHTTMYNLFQDLDSTTSNEERHGVYLFIAATLLQREMIETFVPVQAMIIVTILRSLNVKSNSVVSTWTTNGEYDQAIMYMGIDFGVEILVLILTIVTLRIVLPDVSAWRILSGIFKMHSTTMTMMTISVWFVSLVFQSTHTGMDTSFRFSWLKCDGHSNTTTWLGGFDWEC